MSKKRKKRKKNVRNAGIPARQEMNEGGPARRSPGEGGSLAQQALEREREIRRVAYELYLEEGGGELDALLENGQYTRGAYQSQMTAARDGGEGWGPNVTPYEDRMTRSLQRKLILERRDWIKRCQEKIKAHVEEIELEQREADHEAALAGISSEEIRELFRSRMSGTEEDKVKEPDTPEPAEIKINAGERALEPAGAT